MGFQNAPFQFGKGTAPLGGPFLLSLRKTGMGVWDWDVSGGVAWRSPNRGADLHLCPALAPGGGGGMAWAAHLTCRSLSSAWLAEEIWLENLSSHF